VRRILLFVAGLALATIALLALSPVPPPGRSQPLFAGALVDPPTLALFQHACQDCHSENTVWPWYSRIPPASFMIRRDIDDARRHVDFSRWDSYRPQEKEELLTRIGSVVRSGQMPLPRYTVMHREAALSARERQQIYEWCRAERKRLRASVRPFSSGG
jgi:hypothetical protein